MIATITGTICTYKANNDKVDGFEVEISKADLENMVLEKAKRMIDSDETITGVLSVDIEIAIKE